MRVDIEVDIDINEEDTEEYTLRFDYIPERPSPHCMNPDNPAFYDCGEPAEIEFEGIVYDGEVDNGATVEFLEILEVLESDMEVKYESNVLEQFIEQNNMDY